MNIRLIALVVFSALPAAFSIIAGIIGYLHYRKGCDQKETATTREPLLRTETVNRMKEDAYKNMKSSTEWWMLAYIALAFAALVESLA